MADDIPVEIQKMTDIKLDEFVKSQPARHCEESAPGGRRGNLMKSMSYKERDCFALLAMTSFTTFYETIKVDDLVKSRNSIEYVIPAKAGIQLFQGVLDPGFRRGDDPKVAKAMAA